MKNKTHIKIKSLLLLIVLGIITSCCNKKESFIGLHNFTIMEEYWIKDTTTIVDTWTGKDYKIIKVNKIAPLNIDIFMSGEELNGTYAVTQYQEIKNLTIVNRVHESKSDIHNLHIVNDTLIGEIHHGKKIIDLKLSKNNINVHLTIRVSNIEIETEECNKLATIVNNYITYSSLSATSDESELIKQSNSCAVEKSITKCLESDYKAEKTEYLRKLLSIDPGK